MSLLDLSQDEIVAVLDLADKLAVCWHRREMPDYLAHKNIALIWDAGGFRNRVAFEIGIRALGGTWAEFPGTLDGRESIEDVTRYLANWFDAIVARTRSHEHMLRLSRCGVPVVNARTKYCHPVEILGDLQYIRRRRGSLEGTRVAFVGETTNLCVPWFEAAVRLPIEVVQVCPREFLASDDLLSTTFAAPVGRIATSIDLEATLTGADVVYTDCWPRSDDEREARRIEGAFLPYQVTAELIETFCPKALFLPCPPVTRGQEVSEDAMERHGNEVFEAKEYLLHAQNALLSKLLNGWGPPE